MFRFFDRDSKQEMLTHRASVASLLAANVLPLIGVLLLGWSTFIVVLLYWLENVVLGVINVLKMITCTPDADEVALSLLKYAGDSDDAQRARDQIRTMATSPVANNVGKLFFVPFFTVHYGIFCLVHGMFVVVLLGDPGGEIGGAMDDFSGTVGPKLMSPEVILAMIALAGSHLVSFFTNYLGRGEYRRLVLPVLMFQPYGRIVVMHVAIIFGGIAIEALGSPVFLLIILIVGKTLIDLALHLRERRKSESRAEDLGAATTADPAGDG